MIIYIDFDGVIYDTVSIILNEIKEKEITLDENCNTFFAKLNWEKILNEAEEINSSINAIKNLQKTYNIKILTHVSSINEMEHKFKFIRKKLKNIDIIFVPKSIMKSQIINPINQVLIDDSKKNIDDWKSNGGIGILFGKNGIQSLKEICKIKEVK